MNSNNQQRSSESKGPGRNPRRRPVGKKPTSGEQDVPTAVASVERSVNVPDAGPESGKGTPKQDKKRIKSSPSIGSGDAPVNANNKSSRSVAVVPSLPNSPEPVIETIIPAPPAAPVSKRSDVCFAYQKGKCNRGASCRFQHIRENIAANDSSGEVNSQPFPAAAAPAFVASPPPAPKQQHPQSGKNNRAKPQKINAEVPPASQPAAPQVAPPSPSPKRPSSVLETENEIHMSTEEFRHLNISTASRKAIAEVMKYQYMTQVQASSLPVILDGKDCLAKAKTGTGKTLGFLIPSVELMVKNDKLIDDSDIPTLVISPTRELAIQIAEEAKALLTFHARKAVVCLYGGVKITKDHRQLNQPNIALIVATPGRLNDHLQNTQGFGQRLNKVRMVILDEADQLLDMGFKPAIDQIFRYLPTKENRQTLLFSATVPKAVQDIASATLKTGFAYVDTVGEAAGEQTHEHVPQELAVLPQMTDLVPIVSGVLRKQMNIPHYKILVFFTTARVAGFMADLFNAMGFTIIEIHSRMSQSARTKASDTFRTSSRVIMFSSDVSARGMDYPDVSFVLQVGSTEKAQYIHRLGRTARAGKEGSGMLLLYSFEEQSMLKELKGLPLKRVELHEIEVIQSVAEQCQRTLSNIPTNFELKRSAEQAYQAWLGYYNGKLRVLSWSKTDLVQQAAEYSRSCGLREVPALEAKTIGKMGLKGTPGLKIAPHIPNVPRK